MAFFSDEENLPRGQRLGESKGANAVLRFQKGLGDEADAEAVLDEREDLIGGGRFDIGGKAAVVLEKFLGIEIEGGGAGV